MWAVDSGGMSVAQAPRAPMVGGGDGALNQESPCGQTLKARLGAGAESAEKVEGANPDRPRQRAGCPS